MGCAKVPIGECSDEALHWTYMLRTTKVRIAILGSGAGSNAKALCSAARDSTTLFTVALVISTSAKAGICEVARGEGVELCVIPGDVKGEAFTELLGSLLNDHRIEVLVLAGFMRLLPPEILRRMHGNVLNIRPALLPEFGGKGMYGIHVHEAVIAAHKVESGATVHVVTENYDEGAVVGQMRIPVEATDSPLSLQEKVKVVEHQLYPAAVDQFIRTLR